MNLAAPCIRRIALLVTALSWLSCHKRPPPTPGASPDDALMEQYLSQLEELKAKTRAQALHCADWCNLTWQGCQLSSGACGVSARNPDRPDFQRQCVQTQEDCANLNDRCAQCR